VPLAAIIKPGAGVRAGLMATTGQDGWITIAALVEPDVRPALLPLTLFSSPLDYLRCCDGNAAGNPWIQPRDVS
jgi:hypothetical protein